MQEEATEKQPDALAGLLASLDTFATDEDAKAEYDYDEQHVPSEDEDEEGDDDDAATEDEPDEPDEQDEAKRQKRQVDLASHTQDGVPIFDQGYGVAMNRTEGLRIYQSLLANARSPDGNRVASTESPPILPHHRENSFWRGRTKEKSRHHHQYGKLAAQPTVELDDFDFDARNRTRARAGSSSSVEFRSSRVKPSSTENGSSAISSSKTWPKPASSPVTLGGSPFSNDERISAATAPAVLTKSASAVSAAASGRSRSQQNVFKVTQPSSVPLLSPTPVPVDVKEEPVVRTSPISPAKKRVNKKQLRDLSHLASAVHLVADTRNASGTDNQGRLLLFAWSGLLFAPPMF